MSLCGVCGDRVSEDGHDCWVRKKMQEPMLPLACLSCGEPVRWGLCWKTDCLDVQR